MLTTFYSKELHSIISSNRQLYYVHKCFQSKGYEIRVVGGAVRDWLYGIKANDIDLATNASSKDILKICKEYDIHCIVTNVRYNTFTMVALNYTFEINPAHDWKVDALRRELTINALSLSMDGIVYDYADGFRHLKEGKIIFIDNPIIQNNTSIMRYFRFYGIFGIGDPDIRVLVLIKDHAHLVQNIPGPRLWLEMSKILMTKRVADVLLYMKDTHVLDHMGLGELNPLDTKLIERTTNPITIFSSMLTLEHFSSIASKWKLSKKDKRLGKYLISHRHIELNIDTIRSELVDRVPLEFVIELMRVRNIFPCSIDEILALEIPVFPINEYTLIHMGLSKDARQLLKSMWKDSMYTLTREQLLEHIK